MENEQTEYLGTEKNGCYRPEIRLDNLDVSQVDKSCISSDGFCDFVRIPMIASDNEKFSFEFMFCYLVDQVSVGNDVDSQSENLSLIIDDNLGERQYYMGADVQIDDWDGIRTEILTKKIHPNIQEQATIELALLKITNPEQFLLRYTRMQVAQRPEIMNRFGFYNDCIDSQGSYRSTWITEDHKICVLGYIENVKDENSEVQFLKIGA
jgi:hypothetical protein